MGIIIPWVEIPSWIKNKAGWSPSFLSRCLPTVNTMRPWWRHPQIGATVSIFFLQLHCLRYLVTTKESNYCNLISGVNNCACPEKPFIICQAARSRIFRILGAKLLEFLFLIFFSISNAGNLDGLIWITTFNFVVFSI